MRQTRYQKRDLPNTIYPNDTDIANFASTQTPIEIALQIDENGMTSLKNLYSFLELNYNNYARWTKTNLIENPFATENIDYFPIILNEECGGQSTVEYKITSEFAKQLSMLCKNKKGNQAREYFIACENGLKVTTEKLKNTFHHQQLDLSPLISAITTMNHHYRQIFNT